MSAGSASPSQPGAVPPLFAAPADGPSVPVFATVDDAARLSSGAPSAPSDPRVQAPPAGGRLGPPATAAPADTAADRDQNGPGGEPADSAARGPGRPLTVRLSAIIAASVVLGLIMAGASITVALRLKLTQQIDRQLESTLSSLSAPGRLDAAMSGPSDYVLMVFAPDGARRATLTGFGGERHPPPAVDQLTIADVTAHEGRPFTVAAASGGGAWRAVAADVAPPGRGAALLALPLDSVVATTRSMTLMVVWTALAAAVLATAVGYAMVRRSLRSLKTVERAAARIAAGDLATRIPPAQPGTEVGRLTDSLNAMLAQIEAAFAARGASEARMRSFVSDASHELRTPLAAIRGYAELYRMGGLTDEEAVRGAMRRVEDEAARMGLLVSDLLTLARLDEARPIDRQAVDLAALARDAAADAQALDPSRRVSLIEEAGLSGPPVGGALTAEGHAVVMGNGTASGEDLTPVSNGPAKLGPATASTDREASAWGIASAKGSQGDRTASALGQVVVMGDEAALRRVVTNLVANAVRHTPPGAPIEIGAARRADGWAVLEVRDHGPGIPAAKRRQVFDRFFRVDGSRSRDSGGTGLGLAIVAGLVDAHNGAVEVADTPGGGATFRVSLPPA